MYSFQKLDILQSLTLKNKNRIIPVIKFSAEELQDSQNIMVYLVCFYEMHQHQPMHTAVASWPLKSKLEPSRPASVIIVLRHA